MRFINQLRAHKVTKPAQDIVAGIIVALVSIPIAMGYSQISGLPPIYGLYGSFLPILVFAFLSTSRQFVIGIDAMPAAMVGGLLAVEGIVPESETARRLVPVISLLVAVWFLVFYFLKAGRIIKYISTPVMGGFISGVGLTIIIMQIPKLFGGAAGTGELPALIMHIREQGKYFNFLSLFLGVSTVVIIQVCKKWIPKVPMTVIMMIVGAILQVTLHLNQYGVKLLPEVSAGLPRFMIPDVRVLAVNFSGIALESLSIAAVIMAQTLLATGQYASKYGDTFEPEKELLAYAGMNISAAVIGCCPVNGSVSRSKLADNSGVRSQLMSIAAGGFMLLVLLFFTPLLKYLPIPILTAIVVTALIGIIDTKMAARLWKENRSEFFVFLASMIAVLFLGTVYGVVIGCLLSFWEVAVRATNPPTTFLGWIPGHGNFHSLERNSHARPIKNTVIYRFSGNLFFANMDKFEADIEQAIQPDTRQVVVDARGMGSIDITAVDRLIMFYRKLQMRGIRFYLTEHSSALNDSIRKMGGGVLLDEGVVRITITLALRDAGLIKPYKLEGTSDTSTEDFTESEEKLAEFEWAFGEEAEEHLKKLAEQTADDIVKKARRSDLQHISVLENHGATTDWGMLGLFDEHEFWDYLEAELEKMYDGGKLSKEEKDKILTRIEQRRVEGISRLEKLNPNAVSVLEEHEEKFMEHVKQQDPELYEYLKQHRYFHGQKEMQEIMKNQTNTEDKNETVNY